MHYNPEITPLFIQSEKHRTAALNIHKHIFFRSRKSIFEHSRGFDFKHSIYKRTISHIHRRHIAQSLFDIENVRHLKNKL